MSNKWTAPLLVATLMLGGLSCAQAADSKGGISLGGTRLIFDGSKESASMTVTNSSAADVWLMRFWVSPYGDKPDRGEKKQTMPLVVTPPLYRLDPKSAVQLRVNRLADTLPGDRESVFYLNNLAIPPKKGAENYQKAIQNGLQFAVNTRIKLFYRPAAISDVSAVKAAPGKLTVTQSGKRVVVKNPTPWFITLSQMSVNGKTVGADTDSMIAPFGELSMSTSVEHGTFSYSTVDDFGMTTPKISRNF